ncbi:MAG: WbqC family protein [Chloroflexi bacterium]|nr:WbqC family protein [Chloroflexota bacterium]
MGERGGRRGPAVTVVAIHQPQYLPYLGFFHKLLGCDVFVALDDVQFQKNGLQNRNKIKTGQGWQWLTVPVLHNFGQLINEVEVDPKVPWARKHWQALLSNYSRAPFFETFGPGLKAILDEEINSLCRLNMRLVEWVTELLGIRTPILYSSVLGVAGGQTERLIRICRKVGADCYLSGPGGREYMDLSLFAAAGIGVRWQEFSAPTYEQQFATAGFVPNLSIVDALFNCGEVTRKLLE